MHKLLDQLKKIDAITAITMDQHHDHTLSVFGHTKHEIHTIKNLINDVDFPLNHVVEEDAITVDLEMYTIVYQSMDDMVHQLNRTLFEHIPSLSCTMCLWHHLLYDPILFDRHDHYKKIQKRFTLSYKNRLTERIIDQGLHLLSDHPQSLYYKLTQAYQQHQSYEIMRLTPIIIGVIVDMWFAVKQQTYPSVQHAIDQLSISKDSRDIDFHQQLSLMMVMKDEWTDQRLVCDRLLLLLKQEIESMK
jgi:hypothetical protein